MTVPIARTQILRIPDSTKEKRLAGALRSGCFGIRLDVESGPLGSAADWIGILRVERVKETPTRVSFRISGDLYVSDASLPATTVSRVMPRSNYRMFVTLADDSDGSESIRLAGGKLLLRLRTIQLDQLTWTSGPGLTLQLETPSGNSSSEDFQLTLKKGSTTVATGTMSWRFSAYREISIYPACSADAVFPWTNGAGQSWENLFREIGWEAKVHPPETLVAPTGKVWQLNELHDAILSSNSSAVSLDEHWAVQLLCVHQIEANNDQQRGVMFDFSNLDSNGVPRQAAAVAFGWRIPNTAEWGTARGGLYGTLPRLFFRTSAHEIGHALGMKHPIANDPRRVMVATNTLTGVSGFPDTIATSFSDDEAAWLNHQPDPVVRPGGLPYPAEIMPADFLRRRAVSIRKHFVDCKVAPVKECYPLGAPVRLEFSVQNYGKRTVRAPEELSFSCGGISIAVTSPDEVTRRTSPAISICHHNCRTPLSQGEEAFGAATVWASPQGPLFPVPGLYSVAVQIPVVDSGRFVWVKGNCKIAIAQPTTKAQAKLVDRVLRSTELHQRIVIGAGLSFRGQQLIAAILKCNDLKSHYEYSEAKLGLVKLGNASLTSASELINNHTEMTHQEIRRLLRIADALSAETLSPVGRASIVAILKTLHGLVRVKRLPKPLRDSFNRMLRRLLRSRKRGV